MVSTDFQSWSQNMEMCTFDLKETNGWEFESFNAITSYEEAHTRATAAVKV